MPFGTTTQISSFTTASISSLSVSSINGLEADRLDAAAWSFFPAANPVSMDGNPIVSQTPFTIGVGTPGFETTNATFGAAGDVSIGSYISAPSGLFTSTTTQQANVSSIQASTVNGVIGNFSTLNASTITANTIIALSTVNAVSTISTTVVDATAIVGLSSINGLSLSTLSGASDWSLYPAISTVHLDNNNITGVSSLVTNGVIQNTQTATSTTTNIYSYNVGENFAMFEQISQSPGALSSVTLLTTGGQNNGFDLRYNYGNNTVGAIYMRDGDNGIGIVDKGLNLYSFANNTFTASNISTNAILTSSINGLEFTGANGGSITLSTITSATLSTIAASIVQGFMSSIVFSPSFNIKVETGFGAIGAGLGSIGAGLLALAVAMPVAGYQFGYGLGKGLNSASEPRAINNINNNTFEVYNYATSLQISTLNEQISTIYRFVSTIPSTINDLDGSTLTTSVGIEYFVSTLSDAAPVTCIRGVSDPLQLPSSPFTYTQGFGQWVQLPSGGGVGSNVSTLNLSTLFLLPSTVLQAEPSIGGILRVLEPDLINLGQLEIQGVNIKNDINTATDGIYTGASGIPYWIDQNFSSFQIALQNKPVTFSSITAPGINTTGNVTGLNLIAIQQPSNPNSAQGYLRTSIDVAGDAGFFGLSSNFSSWGKFLINPGSNGIDMYNAIGGVAVGTKINIGSNGALNFTDSGNNLMTYSSATLFVNNISTGTSFLPANASLSTLVVQSNISSGTLVTGTVYANSVEGSLTGGTVSATTGTFSTVNTQALNLTPPSLVAPTSVINTNSYGSLVSAFLDLATPNQYITTINNLDTDGALQGKVSINLNGYTSSIGINKIGDLGYALDVAGGIRAAGANGNITAHVGYISTIETATALVLKSLDTVELTPGAAWWVNVNASNTGGNGQGEIRFGDSKVFITGYGGLEYYVANNYYPGSYNAGWTNYVGRAVRVEYATTIDNTFGGGLGKAEFVLPVGFSTLASMQATYVAFGDASPGLTHPTWLYSTINDANGQISTIQVGGGQNSDVFISVLGYV